MHEEMMVEVNIHVDQKTVTLRLNGSFTYSAYLTFKEAIQRVLLSHDTHEVHIDFSNVDYVDSAALGMLSFFNKHAQHLKIHLCNCKGLVKAVLAMALQDQEFRGIQLQESIACSPLTLIS
jgi:anti-anti-sigma factor